jgi:hypothetical protein
MTTQEVSIEEIEQRWKRLTSRREDIIRSKTKVETILDSRKKILKETISACRVAGFDPDTLVEEVRRKKQVLSLKLDAFDADLTSAEQMLAPMLKEIG